MVSPSRMRAGVGLVVAAGVALGLAGCGSDDPATTASAREAAGDAACPEQRGSDANYLTFINDLDTDVTLQVSRDSWSCTGYSGVSTPGALDGRVIGRPGAQPRIRLESYQSGPDTKFTMAIQASGATLATVDVSRFPYPGQIYPWGISVNGSNTCYRPVVELKDASGAGLGWLTMTKRCITSASGDVVFQLSKNKPWT